MEYVITFLALAASLLALFSPVFSHRHRFSRPKEIAKGSCAHQ
jgi:hypothetical protein